MSSANNHKRHTLEEEFQRRLFDAEASPAPDLWARIDHDLTLQENKDYRKRVLFYRQLAAACFVLFAITGALLGYHYSDEMNHGLPQPGMAALPGSEKKTTETITPEAAMQAYMQHAEPAAVAQGPAAEPAAPAKPFIPATTPTQSSTAFATPVATQEQTERGSYYNATPGYNPYLGYGTVVGNNRGFVSGGISGYTASPGYSASAGFGETGATGGNRYSQIITWESVTITFGNSANRERGATQQDRSLAAKPRSFVEMSEQQSTMRQWQNQQQAQAIAATLNKKKESKSDSQRNSDSRWSLNLAYAPTYFEQNIGLPDPLAVSTGRNTFGIAGPSASATQDSYQNMSAAREEYKERTEPAFSYAMEVKTGFKLKERLKLLTGIGYSESTARTKTNYIVRQFWNKPRTNERYELAPSTIFLSSLNNDFASDSISVARTGEAFDVEYKYRHLSVPVGLQYEHDIAKDWFVYAAGGVAANFLLESSVSASDSEVQSASYTPKDKDSPFRKMQFSGNMSMGVGKRLSNNLTLALGPEVRNYFSTLVAEPENAMAPQGRPYSVGINMALNYQLGSTRR